VTVGSEKTHARSQDRAAICQSVKPHARTHAWCNALYTAWSHLCLYTRGRRFVWHQIGFDLIGFSSLAMTSWQGDKRKTGERRVVVHFKFSVVEKMSESCGPKMQNLCLKTADFGGKFQSKV